MCPSHGLTMSEDEDPPGPPSAPANPPSPGTSQPIRASRCGALRPRRGALRPRVALPLNTDGKVIGALNIYAAEPDSFDDQEEQLLTELAADLSFGIQSIRIRTEKAAAEARAGRQLKHLSALAHIDRAIMASLDPR
ncbi:MAG: GAF domain-containing protein [Chloroflexota bacterium]